MALFKRTSGSDKRGLLARLGRDATGNVFAMTAAAVVPMIGVVGGAIDASRMYMTRSRLQAACDSAVLSGRKAMTTLTLGDAEKAQARAMFNFNFQDSDFGTTGTLFTPTGESNGRVNGAASTSVPMTLMKVFGFQNRAVSVNCSADIQIPNIDIVFVLDVTGSMDETVSGTRKIDALQSAMGRFYDEIFTRVGAAGANRVRYGFVPYSQTVNVSRLFTSTSATTAGQTNGEAPLSHLAGTMTVESRMANFSAETKSTVTADTTASPIEFSQTFSDTDTDSHKPFEASSSDVENINESDCNRYVVNTDFEHDDDWYNLYPTSGSDDAPILYAVNSTDTTATRTEPAQNSFWKITFSKVSGSDNKKLKPCVRRVKWTKQKRTNVVVYEFENYTYQPVTLPSANFRDGGTVTYVREVESDYVPTQAGSFNMIEMAAWSDPGDDLKTSTTRWDGCIEERDSVATDDWSPIPTDAWDLNSLAGGTTAQTRWRPVFDNLTWNRGRQGNLTSTDPYLSRPGYSCPTSTVRNLKNWTEAEFDAYVTTLDPPVGFTYLDVGMIWGLRLIAPQGIWGARNLTGVGGGQISRHLIFLTDGQPVSQADTYSSYGVERMSRRVVGSNSLSDAAQRHEDRFHAMCDSMRGTVTIWTIAFDTPDGDILERCADPGRAKTASDSASLNSVFTEIANDISDLRLVQ